MALTDVSDQYEFDDDYENDDYLTGRNHKVIQTQNLSSIDSISRNDYFDDYDDYDHPDNDTKKIRQSNMIKWAIEKYFVVVFAFFIAFFLEHYVVSFNFIPSRSMEPALYAGDVLLGSRNTKKIQRGDIVTCYSEDGELLAKRVIGMPGETIKIIGARVYIDGIRLDESEYIVSDWNTAGECWNCVIPENEYFVMGDNRDISDDSRYTGTVAFEKIEAKVILVLHGVKDEKTGKPHIPSKIEKISGIHYPNHELLYTEENSL